MSAPKVAGTRDVEVLAYVLDALRRQEVRHRQNHWPVPDAVAELILSIGFEVSRGQQTSKVASSSEDEHLGSIDPAAFKYQTAAKILGVSLSTIQRMIRDGRLRTVSLGPNTTRIPRAAIDELLEQRAGTTR